MPKRKHDEGLRNRKEPTVGSKEQERGEEARPVEGKGDERKTEREGGGCGNCRYRIASVILGVVLRLVLYYSCKQWLEERPEFATPLVALERLREGVLLQRDIGDAYAGDRVHVQPMLISLATLFPLSDLYLFIFFTILDLASAHLLSMGVGSFLRESRSAWEADQVASTVHRCFLLNPFSMMACASLSLATLYTFIGSAFVAAFLLRSCIASLVVLAVWTQLSMYPVILLAPLLIRFKLSMVKATLMLVSFGLLVGGLVALNWHLAGRSWRFVECTYIFTVLVEDLTPNVGIYWYFFTEIFTYFHDLFIALFQLNIVVYIFPLAATLRKAPHLNLLVSLVLMAVFTPYPSLADASLFIALVPLVEDRLWQNLRFPLVESCTMVVCVVLMPVMWHLWIVSGSGNANFYFGVTLCYNIALIYMGMDLVYAYLKTELKRRCPVDTKDPAEDTKCLILFD